MYFLLTELCTILFYSSHDSSVNEELESQQFLYESQDELQGLPKRVHGSSCDSQFRYELFCPSHDSSASAFTHRIDCRTSCSSLPCSWHAGPCRNLSSKPSEDSICCCRRSSLLYIDIIINSRQFHFAVFCAYYVFYFYFLI